MKLYFSKQNVYKLMNIYIYIFFRYMLLKILTNLNRQHTTFMQFYVWITNSLESVCHESSSRISVAFSAGKSIFDGKQYAVIFVS